jgi:hypothetical protein
VNSTQWKTGCSLFVPITANGTQAPVAFLNNVYKVALYVENPASNAEVSLMLGEEGSADICVKPGEIYDEDLEECVVPHPLETNSHVIKFEHDVPQYFVIDSGKLVGSIYLCEEDVPEQAATVTFYVRRNGAPSKEHNDYVGSCVTITSPRVGQYYVRAVPTSQGDKNITLIVENCASIPGKAGPGCSIDYKQASPLMTQTLGTNYVYWQVNVSVAINLYVSVRSQNGTNNPQIYASMGQIPSEGNADVSGCNQGACGAVNAIMVNITGANQTWFVGINGVNDTVYGIWYNSICAPNCDDHGECTLTGLQAGVCECVADFIGVDCGTTNGLGAQYIVLIIIASLVVASAVIGFIAWAYMRRKRVDYEHVS